MRVGKHITAALILFLVASLVSAADRSRAVRPALPRTTLAVGQEYRIPATPDSPWLESVAVAIGPSSGIVLWTEDGPGTGEAIIRFARLATDGRPRDNAGRPLFENGHVQAHVAIDAFKDHFVAAWCDIAGGNTQILATLLDSEGRASVPVIVADNIGSYAPDVNVTCNNAGCLVSWAGSGSYGQLSIGSVNAQVFSTSASATHSVISLAPKGIGIGIGTDNLNFCTAYAEPIAYGRSGALVAKIIAANGTTNEMDVLPSTANEVGSTWMAWDGRQWLLLMLDLTTSGQLAQEFRFMRIDVAGRPLGDSAPTLVESGGVPLLCPFVPDLFLYDPQNRRVVWDGTHFLILTQHAIIPVATDGVVGARVSTDDYFPRSYALSVSSTGNGRTIVAYSRDTAVAIRAIEEVP